MSKDTVEKLVRIVYVPVKGNPFDMTIVPSVEMFQSLVEGYFAFGNLDQITMMAYNQDQWSEKFNFGINGHKIRGAVFFIGRVGKHWVDCPKTAKEIMDIITKGGTDGNIV